MLSIYRYKIDQCTKLIEFLRILFTLFENTHIHKIAGSWTKDSIFGHKKEDTNINMQKSKSSTNVGQVFSKKIWKSRSKSQTRPDSPAQPHWTPQVNNIFLFSIVSDFNSKNMNLNAFIDLFSKTGKLHLEIVNWEIFTLKKDSFTRAKRCGTKKFTTHCVGSNKSAEYWCAG